MSHQYDRSARGVALCLILFSMISCGAPSSGYEPMSISPDVIARVSELRLFFGHQSVGANILDGLLELGIPNRDIRGDGESATSGNVPIQHAFVGRNEHPEEKITDFAEMVNSGELGEIDVAMLKFCYVDAGNELGAQEIFERYVEEMETLESRHPDTVFVYMTMPLTSPRGGLKSLVKRVLGMETPGREENIERNRFNQLLRNAKGESDRLFDIAQIESTHTDGTQEKFTFEGETYQALVPEYTYDGGHLNDYGRSIVATKLVEFLAQLPESADGQ